MVDDDGRPKGWLSERGLQGERVREDCRSPAEPIVELDDILRDALSDLLGSDSQYGPVVDADGRVAGVLSMEVLSHALSVPRRARPERHRAGDRPRGARGAPRNGLGDRHVRLTFAAGARADGDDFFGDRENAVERCPGNNGLCPGWIADNFSDYLNPLWEHVLLSVVPLAIGFVVATGLALLAHRYKVAAALRSWRSWARCSRSPRSPST